jgi:hypothetical protein
LITRATGLPSPRMTGTKSAKKGMSVRGGRQRAGSCWSRGRTGGILGSPQRHEGGLSCTGGRVRCCKQNPGGTGVCSLTLPGLDATWHLLPKLSNCRLQMKSVITDDRLSVVKIVCLNRRSSDRRQKHQLILAEDDQNSKSSYEIGRTV